MSAVLRNALSRDSRFDSFEAPYADMNAAELLTYFQNRQHIRYFSVLDETQVSPEKLAGILDYCFEFNNEAYRLTTDFDWQSNPSSDIEWLILLHKFYYAVGLGRAFHESGDLRYQQRWLELTKHWMTSVPVDFLSSDVTGRRVQNWIFAYRYFVVLKPTAELDADFHLDFLVSIRQQVAYLCGHLTAARNHRTLELYAIFLAAVVFPELKGAKAWLQFSITELQRNLETDVLADGVHCELSTDYHHIVLRNFLGIRRLAAMNEIVLPEAMDAAIKRALEFSLYVHKPDGLIPSISDGDTANFLDLLRQGYQLYGDPDLLYVATAGQQGQAPKQNSKTFASSGYSIIRSGWGDQGEPYQDERYLFFDCAALGAGNHGHLDLLNIEMAAYGQSLIVDPGRYTYDESGPINWRVLFRGTRYHNTVQVDGKNQTRYEAHPRKYKIQGPEPERKMPAAFSRPGFDYLHGIAASHEYPVIHERKILFIAGEYWLICDLLRAAEQHHYELRFHLNALAEQQTATFSSVELLRIDAPNLLMLQPHHKDTTLLMEQGFVSPTYGIKHAAPIVNFSRRGATTCFYTLLHPYKSEIPDISMERIPVYRGKHAVNDDLAAAFSIRTTKPWGYCHDEIFVAHDAADTLRFNDLVTNSPFLFRRRDAQGRILAYHDHDSCALENR
ncbi:MAG: alginate lyase family protein [Methylococcales bacterium]